MARKSLLLFLSLALLFAVNGAAADVYALNGDGETTVRFFVESYGNAEINLQQTEGKCQELSYTHLIDGILGEEEEWGKYYFYITAPNGAYSAVTWNKTFHGDEFTLNLSGVGIYQIEVVPFTADQMTESWTLDRFVGWTVLPRWRIASYRNCSVSERDYRQEKRTGRIEIRCYDEYGSLIKTESRNVSQSGQVNPPPISGYEAVSSGRYVSLDPYTGSCSPSSVDFTYRRTGGGGGGTSSVTPYDWDTKFKAGVSTKNPNAYLQLHRLTDGNPDTVFSYWLYNSDKKNPTPDFSAFFSNSAVNGIKIRNGDAGDYERYMRVNQFHVVVYEGGRSYSERVMTVPDQLNYDYYSFDFSRTYYNVTRIDIYIDDRNVGRGEETNLVRIRDIAFY